MCRQNAPRRSSRWASADGSAAIFRGTMGSFGSTFSALMCLDFHGAAGAATLATSVDGERHARAAQAADEVHTHRGRRSEDAETGVELRAVLGEAQGGLS